MARITPQITIPVIEQGKREGTSTDTQGRRHPFTEFMSVDEGNVLYDLVRELRPATIVELGMGQGVSSLYMLQALADNGLEHARLISVESSMDEWPTGVALNGIQRAGLQRYHVHVALPSEFGLPRLLQNDVKWDMAFVDSNHQFDQTIVETFFVNKGLAVGGVVAYHDINLLSVQSACNFAESNLGYSLHPIHARLTTKEIGDLKIFTKTAADTREWFHFLPFTVPQGDQMTPRLLVKQQAALA